MANVLARAGEVDDVAHETEIERDHFLAAMEAETQIKLWPVSAVACFPIVGFSAEQQIAKRGRRSGRHGDKSGFLIALLAVIDAAIRSGCGREVMQDADFDFVGIAHELEIFRRAEEFSDARNGFDRKRRPDAKQANEE